MVQLNAFMTDFQETNISSLDSNLRYNSKTKENPYPQCIRIYHIQQKKRRKYVDNDDNVDNDKHRIDTYIRERISVAYGIYR